jgi:hypothetical protein
VSVTDRSHLIFATKADVTACYVCGEPLAPWPSHVFSPPAFAPRWIAVHSACESDFVTIAEHNHLLRSLG